MANEITSTKTLMVNKGGFNVNQSHTAVESMAGNEMLKDTQVVGTTWELVTLGEISGVPAEIQVCNLDPITVTTNYVELAVATNNTGIFAQIRPGKAAQWPPAATGIFARSYTANVRIGKTAADSVA